MSRVPSWLLQVHCKNYKDLLTGRNNPSTIENELAIEMYQIALPKSGFSDFKYIILNEWRVDDRNPRLGKGDLVLSNGKNILVVEIKRVREYCKTVQLKCLLKVIKQSRYYSLMIKKMRDRRNFPNYLFNEYFKNAKIHAAFYTNLNQNIILLKHPKKISEQNKIRMEKMEKGLTTQEIINNNQLDIQTVDEKTPCKKYQYQEQFEVKVEYPETPSPIDSPTTINSPEQIDSPYLYRKSTTPPILDSPPKQLTSLNIQQQKPTIIDLTPQMQQNSPSSNINNNIQKTPNSNTKLSPPIIIDLEQMIKSTAKPKTIKDQNISQNGNQMQIQTYTDSKNRTFLVDNNQWTKEDDLFISIHSDEGDNENYIQIIESEKKPFKKQDDIVFLNEIKPRKPISPDVVIIEKAINVPVYKLQNLNNQNSSKLLPFNLQLSLQQNLNIDCTLKAVTDPNQNEKQQIKLNNKFDEDLQSDISFQSLNEVDQVLNPQNMQRPNFMALNTMEACKQSLKEIVKQQMRDQQIEDITHKHDITLNKNNSPPNKLQQQILNMQNNTQDTTQKQNYKCSECYERNRNNQINTININNNYNITNNNNNQQIIVQSDHQYDIIDKIFDDRIDKISDESIDKIFYDDNKNDKNKKEKVNQKQKENNKSKNIQKNDSFSELMYEMITISERLEEHQDKVNQLSIVLDKQSIKQNNNKNNVTQSKKRQLNKLLINKIDDDDDIFEYNYYSNELKNNQKKSQQPKISSPPPTIPNTKFNQQIRKIVRIQSQIKEDKQQPQQQISQQQQQQNQSFDNPKKLIELSFSQINKEQLQEQESIIEKQEQFQPKLNLQNGKFKIIKSNEIFLGKKISIVRKPTKFKIVRQQNQNQ